MTAVCLAHLSGAQEPLYLACHKDDCPRAVVVYKQRPAVEQQNRDLKRNFLLRKLPLKNAARLERMWIILGRALYISYCNETAHESALRDRMSRRYKDGRKDFSWLNRAKCAELCGGVEVLLAPIQAQENTQEHPKNAENAVEKALLWPWWLLNFFTFYPFGYESAASRGAYC